jgi:integrase
LRGEVLNAIARGTFDYATLFPNSERALLFSTTAPTRVTIGTLLDDYLNRVAKKALSPSTVRGYADAVRSHLKPHFGQMPVQELRRAQVKEWILGLDLSLKRIRNLLLPLGNVLKDALDAGLIEHNPLADIDPAKFVSPEQRTRPKARVNPLSPDEIEKVLRACDGQMRNFFAFALFSGLRTSELIPLRWRDIDMGKATVLVTHTKVKGVELATGEGGPRRPMVERDLTKTSSRGLEPVYLLPAAMDALHAQEPLTGRYGDAHVFLCPLTGEPWTDDQQVRHQWRRILARAGVPYRNPYQTRHSFASNLLSQGAPPLWVAQQLGHTSMEMINRHYGKWVDSDRKEPYRFSGQFGRNLGDLGDISGQPTTTTEVSENHTKTTKS